MAKQRLIHLALKDFALPVPRVGSIEALSGYGRAPQIGQETHSRIQEGRRRESPDYKAEVFVRRELTHGKYRFQVAGRMDGIFTPQAPESPCIEEIKTALPIDELARRLETGTETHPYCLQLRTYGYFHYLAQGVVPRLRFLLVSTRNFQELVLEIPLELPRYESWLQRRLDELVQEASGNEKRAKRRKKLAANLPFPFSQARPGQEDLIKTVEKALTQQNRLLIQAPTGLGKTVGVLYPVMKEALGRGKNVVYVTPKNSQHSVAEDAIDRFEALGAKVRSLTITAKSKICFKPEPLCTPEFCEYARDYYTKLGSNTVLEELHGKQRLTPQVFRDLGEKHEVCPFELQLESAKNADIVICDYNYVFSPRAAAAGWIEGKTGSGSGETGKPSLVIDEAHNLISRSLDYYSPSLSTSGLERMRMRIVDLSDGFRVQALQALDEAIATVRQCQPSGPPKPQVISPPVGAFLDLELKLKQLLTRYLESDEEIQARDPVIGLCRYWTEFTEALGLAADPQREEFFTTFQPGPESSVRITCCDASQMLKSRYTEFEQVVAFSATLKPFDYYAKLVGLSETQLETAEFSSPFPAHHRKILIIPQISTKYSERHRNYPKVAETVQRMIQIRPGNYFVFFPSFVFLEKTLEIFKAPPGFEILRQQREMRAENTRLVCDRLRQGGGPAVVFAVQGGVFSEGIDYPGDTLIGAFIVGPPLPSFDLEREKMREFYHARYGAGFEYAYSFPAMAKAIQAAGRVIRSENDRGLIVLMDDRFLRSGYADSMPSGWYETNPRELVSQTILRDVTAFWKGQDRDN